MKRIYKILILLLCITFFLPFSFIVHEKEVSKDGIPILGYHGVVSDEQKKTLYKDDPYTISVSQLEKHFQYLKDNNYHTYSMDELYDYYQSHHKVYEKGISLTFDDGLLNFNTYVKPLLEKYNFHGTCFVIGKHTIDNNENFLKTKDMIPTSYVSYYSHSYDLHRKANGFNKKIIETLSKDDIKKDFQHKEVDSTYFAFPYGRSTDEIEDILKENKVRLAFSYNQFRHMTYNDNPYYLPRYLICDLTPMFYFKFIIK